jgi:hypothetical protein
MAYLRKTPYQRIRYPWASDVASAPDVQSMTNDIDQAIVTTQKFANDYSMMGSVIAKRNAALSLTKGVLTAVTFDSITLNNGSNSPLANGNWWAAGNPTRLTAPVPCVVLASAFGGVNLGSALGVNGVIQVTVGLNGLTAWQQGHKFSPISTYSGQVWGSGLTMWPLNAGDYLELKLYWTGTPAGPFNTDTVIPPQLSLSMLALKSVS